MTRLLLRVLLLIVLLSPPLVAEADDAAPAASSSASQPVEIPPAASPSATQATEILPATAPTAPLQPQDLSPWGMFLSADPLVKVVMIGLLLASVVTWTVWLAKTLELAAAKRRERAGVAALMAARSLGGAAKQLANAPGPVATMVHEAVEERQLSEEAGAGILDRIRMRLQRREMAARRSAGRYVGILATIGATSPFVGLFGTVWGIMNSFLGIAKSHTTNLAVVAPGIAEALLATAAGLVAAIPAVVIYNFIARSITDYRATLGDASAEILRLASRDLDGGRVKLSEAAE